MPLSIPISAGTVGPRAATMLILNPGQVIPVNTLIFVACLCDMDVMNNVQDSLGNQYIIINSGMNQPWPRLASAYTIVTVPYAANSIIGLYFGQPILLKTAAAMAFTGVDMEDPLDLNMAQVSGTDVATAPIIPRQLEAGTEMLIGIVGSDAQFSAFTPNSPFTPVSGISAPGGSLQLAYAVAKPGPPLIWQPSFGGSNIYSAGLVSFVGEPLWVADAPIFDGWTQEVSL
jgi:hypothetical protein